MIHSEIKGCRLCRGLSKRKCMACGHKCKAVRDMTPIEVIRYEAHKEYFEYLEKLYKTLINLKQKTTGCESLDEQVIKYIGQFKW